MQQQMASMPPEMMQQAMQMAKNATPEQIAQMRAAAASLPPETLAAQANQAAGMYAGQGAGSQQRQQLDAAAQLKAEGNRLHGAKAWREASEKYERAVSTLAGQCVHVANRLDGPTLGPAVIAPTWPQTAHLGGSLQGRNPPPACSLSRIAAPSCPAGQTSRESQELRTSCQSNLASCALQLGQWERCAQLCGTVLAADANNRKALYRRGEPRRRCSPLPAL